MENGETHNHGEHLNMMTMTISTTAMPKKNNK